MITPWRRPASLAGARAAEEVGPAVAREADPCPENCGARAANLSHRAGTAWAGPRPIGLPARQQGQDGVNPRPSRGHAGKGDRSRPWSSRWPRRCHRALVLRASLSELPGLSFRWRLFASGAHCRLEGLTSLVRHGIAPTFLIFFARQGSRSGLARINSCCLPIARKSWLSIAKPRCPLARFPSYLSASRLRPAISTCRGKKSTWSLRPMCMRMSRPPRKGRRSWSSGWSRRKSRSSSTMKAPSCGAMTFNGSIPAPLMVVHEGDYVEVTLVNPGPAIPCRTTSTSIRPRAPRAAATSP